MNYHCRTCASAWWPRPLRAQRKGAGHFIQCPGWKFDEIPGWQEDGWFPKVLNQIWISSTNRGNGWYLSILFGVYAAFFLKWTNRNDSAWIFNPLEGSFWEISVSCTACSGLLLWDFAATRSKNGRNTFSWRGYVIENLMKSRFFCEDTVAPNFFHDRSTGTSQRLRIRNINPLTATYQCRFYIFMEWFDQAAIGMPPGDVSEDLVCNPPQLSFFVSGVCFWEGSTTCWLYLMISSRRIERSFGFQRSPCKTPWRQAVDWIVSPRSAPRNQKTHTFLRFLVFPPIGFWVCWWNALFLGANGKGVEIHYPPEIIFSEKGHVAAKVLYQAGHWLVKFCVLLTPEISHR